MILTPYFINMEIHEFIKRGWIDFSNHECLPEYEDELRRRRIDYRVVRGLGDYGIRFVICKPEKFTGFMDQLNREVARTEEILTIKKAAQQTVSGES